MLCILSPSNIPAFNLAAEEYLFRNFSDDVFFLYVNEPSVVVGKHQNALAEINHSFIRENNIPVIRRLSGGGAVYHDLGNLNFSFHQTVADTAKISFKTFNKPVVEVLNRMSVPAEISQRNDIVVNGFKVSGHADHVFRNRVLSHGTLLFNANRENLSKALNNNPGTYRGKAIQSVRSKVANVVDLLSEPIEMNAFIQKIIQHILTVSEHGTIYRLTESDQQKIQQLAENKYTTWEWNFGYSPKYRFEKTMNSCSVALQVEKGIITQIEIELDEPNRTKTTAIQNNLLNCKHEYSLINEFLSSPEVNQPELINCFF